MIFELHHKRRVGGHVFRVRAAAYSPGILDFSLENNTLKTENWGRYSIHSPEQHTKSPQESHVYIIVFLAAILEKDDFWRNFGIIFSLP